MTRVTAPMSKLARGLTSSHSVAWAHSASKAAGSVLARSTELSADGRSSEHDSSRRSLTTAHRPVTVAPNSHRVGIPLMQTFHSSAPRDYARMDTSTIDFMMLPSIVEDATPYSFTTMRVPLLPDNFSPDRSSLAAEAADEPLAAPVISVVAAHPENVVVAGLTEVEGMGVDGVELKFVHDFSGAEGQSSVEHSGGMLRDMWNGLLDDVLGPQKKAAV